MSTLPPPNPDTVATPDAQLFSQGYRRFDGERGGLPGAMWALTVHSIRHVLGFGRPARYKVGPFIVIGLSFLNAIGNISIAGFMGASGFAEIGFNYSDTINLTMVALFTALVTPGILVDDRSSGMYRMYLTTPLTTGTYLISKAAAIWLTLTVVTAGPGLLQLVGLSLQRFPPADGWWRTFLAIVASGTLLASIFGTVAMAASALTKRAMLAGIAIVGLLSGGGVLAIAVLNSNYSPNWALVSTYFCGDQLVTALFGETLSSGVTKSAVYLAAAIHFIVASAVVAWRYFTVGEDER